jgi:U32 family peptidase
LQKRIELLAPGGDVDSIKAAIAAGADAVYCGVNKFNARNRASNISFEDLNGILRLAHNNNCEVFLTLNIIVTEQEIPDLIRLLNKLINTSIDGVIIQDLGLFHLLSNYFKGLEIHASTQLTTHNEGQVKFLAKLNATRVNLSRELSLEEIKPLSLLAHQHNLLTEVFVHGSYCISFSGLCYMSSVHGGNSGNRGRCSQPCRDRYLTTPTGSQFPLNLKDNSAWFDLKEISEAGVDSIKIEGRIKKFHYVYTVVESYRKQLERLYDGKRLSLDNERLFKVFNRDFSNGYLKGEITREMFIDNPRDNSATHLAASTGSTSNEAIENAENELYAEKSGIRSFVKSITDQLSTGKTPLTMILSGKEGEALKVDIKTPESSISLRSEMNLMSNEKMSLNRMEVLKRFKALNDTEYFIDQLDLAYLDPGIFIPFSELTMLKKRILFFLRDSREHVDPIELPILKMQGRLTSSPALLVLISSQKDLNLCEDTSANIFYQLPDSLSDKISEYADLFKENRSISPWFPAVLIGEDFNDAVNLLLELKPKQIVTDNTGIAYEAFRLGIPWIAGPRLNLVNSYSLLTLKEIFNCSGAFISNELKRQQIKGIKKPDDFDLYYSIYHPMELMISRQCFFQQVTGCEKEKIDNECIRSCRKSATVTNLKKESFFIDKKAGSYNRIYNEHNFLNTDIVNDIPDIFTGYLIDLRNIKTLTRVAMDKSKTIELFENHLKGIPGSAEQLKQAIDPSSDSQYVIGI